MPDQQSDRERISVLETHIPNLNKTTEAIWAAIARGELNDREMIQQNATILTTLKEMKETTAKYQEACDSDRKEIGKGIEGVKMRVQNTENYQSNQNRNAGIIAITLTTIINIGIGVFTGLKKG